MNNNPEDMKVYRPRNKFPVYTYLAVGIFMIAVAILGFQNVGLRREIKTLKEAGISETVRKNEETPGPETQNLSQQNVTENWRIYRNITYSYKFRTPKSYSAKVNNIRNSVEIFNENSQKIIEVSATPKTGSDEVKTTGGTEIYGETEFSINKFQEGSDEIKSPHSQFVTSNDKYTVSIYILNSVNPGEMEKLILSTFAFTN